MSVPAGFPGGSVANGPPASAGDAASIPGSERSPEKEMATPSSVLAWGIPRTEGPGGLQSMGLQRVRHRGACTPDCAALGLLSSWDTVCKPVLWSCEMEHFAGGVSLSAPSLGWCMCLSGPLSRTPCLSLSLFSLSLSHTGNFSSFSLGKLYTCSLRSLRR